MPIPKFQCQHAYMDVPCQHRHLANYTDHTLRVAERTITKSRDLVLEMRRLLMKHAPIADEEIIAALARSYDLVGD